jgi:hypothetical protein
MGNTDILYFELAKAKEARKEALEQATTTLAELRRLR